VRRFVSKEDPMSSLSLVDVETEEVIVRVERRQHASLTHQQSPSLSLCLCLSSSVPLPSLPRSLSLCLCLSSCLPFPSLSRSLSLCSLCLSSSLPHSPEAEARGGGGSGGVISTRNRRKRRMSRKEWSRRRNMRKRKMEEWGRRRRKGGVKAVARRKTRWGWICQWIRGVEFQSRLCRLSIFSMLKLFCYSAQLSNSSISLS